MKSFVIFSSCVFLLLSSCIKKVETPTPEPEPIVNTPLTEGLPENISSINGYFYFSGSQNGNSRAFATFSDPRKNLIPSFNHFNNFETQRIGNLSVGRVTCLGAMLQEIDDGENSFNYSGFPSGGPVSAISWAIEGNGPFVGFSVILPRGAPAIDINALPYELYRSKGLTLDLATLIPVYDSLIVTLNANSQVLKKRAINSQKQIVFTPAEIGDVFQFQSFTQLNIFAFNYSHTTVNSKNYIFECGSSNLRSLQIYD